MNDLLDKIKNRGYWQVIIRPSKFQKDLIESPAECKRLILDLRVKLRGWDYPHYNHDNPPTAGTNYIEQTTEWETDLEFWRYYQSGQFIHFFAMREDWQEKASTISKLNVKPFSVLGITNALYTITEIYEFSARLSTKNLLGESCQISIGLHNIKDRVLSDFQPGRVPLRGIYRSNETSLTHKTSTSNDELIAESAKLALDHTIWFFHRFNWDSPPVSVLKDDQEKLLRRKS